MNPVVYQRVEVSALSLDPAEVARRLQSARGYADTTTRACQARLEAVLDPKYSGIRVPVRHIREDVLDLGFGEVHSHALFRNLDGAEEAFIFAATLGVGTDRLLARLALVSPAEHFITDALASAYAEALAEHADEALCGALGGRARFSPGYGDLSLEVQPHILQMVEGMRLLGITLGKSLLMSPMKSVTAIRGIQKQV